MITGFNTDVEHAGTTYHVQTEDKGLKTPLILSLVYVGGTILASKRTSYQDLIEGGFEETTLVERLQRQHKLLCAAIRAGRIEDLKRMSADAREAAHTPPAPASVITADIPPNITANALPVVFPNETMANTTANATAINETAAISPSVSTVVAPDALPPVPPRVVAPTPPAASASSNTLTTETPSVSTVTPAAAPETTPPPTRPARVPSAKKSPSTAAPKTPPATTDEIEIISINDPSFESVSAPDASHAPRVGAIDDSFELIPANDSSFLPPAETVAATLPPAPAETHVRPTTNAAESLSKPLREDRTTLEDKSAASEASIAGEPHAPPTPPAEAPAMVGAKSDTLYVSLLDDEGDFRAGELVTIRIHVGFGQYGSRPVADAAVTVKILGTTFRPLILSTKTNADGIAIVRALLPRFSSGRAAILIRARAVEQEAELRRIIHHN
ncbi:MAG TPA: hypothetical protein VF666_06150 [Pyrinomonadaceae bacterium]